MTELKRHDLLFLNAACLERAEKHAMEAFPCLPAEAVRGWFSGGVPAIVRRQDSCPMGWVDAGVSLPWREGNIRARFSVRIAVQEIERVLTPFDAAAIAACQDGPRAALLKELMMFGKNAGLAVGVFGSCALEALTSYSYTHDTSDLDIFLRADARKIDTVSFYRSASKSAWAWGIELDIEIDCGGYGVKLLELLGSGRTVLGKGLYDAKMLDKKELFAAEEG